MKIITSNVEAVCLHKQILKSEINIKNITMKDMEEKLEGVNVETPNKLCSRKLEIESIIEIPNGTTNGFKETIDKPTLLTNGSADFEEISDDELHLELEASDEEQRSEEIESNLSFSKKDFFSKISADSKKNSIQPDPVEIVDVQNIPEKSPLRKQTNLRTKKETTKVEFVSKKLNTSDRVMLTESDHKLIKVESLLDCRKHEELSSDTNNEEEKSTVVNRLYTGNSNVSDNTVEVNLAFSEIIENSGTNVNLEKVEHTNLQKDLCESGLNKLNFHNKTKKIEMSLDSNKTKSNDISSEESLPIQNLPESHSNECFVEVDTGNDSNSLCTPEEYSACSVQAPQKTSPLRNSDDDDLMIPVALNSDSNLQKDLCESDLNKLNFDNKTEIMEISIDSNKNKTNNISLEESLPVQNLPKSHSNEYFMEVDTGNDSNSLCIPEKHSACSLHIPQKSLPLKNSDQDVFIIPVVLNSKESKNDYNTLKAIEDKKLDELVLNASTKSVELGSEDKAVAMEIDEKCPLEITFVTDTKEDNPPLQVALNKHTFNNVRPKLTKSSSGDEISQSHVLESVQENGDKQIKDIDNDHFDNIVSFASVVENNHVLTTGRDIDLLDEQLSVEEEKNTQESGSTINGSENWIVLDEISESFSSSDEQTATTPRKVTSLSTICNVEDENNMEVEDYVNIWQTGATGSNGNEDIHLIKDVNEIKQFDIVNDCDEEHPRDETNVNVILPVKEDPSYETVVHVTLPVTEGNKPIILSNKEVTDLCEEVNDTKEIECFNLSDEVKNDVHNGESVSKEREEMFVDSNELPPNEVEEETFVEQVYTIVSDNEKNSDLSFDQPVVKEDNSIQLVNENNTGENMSVHSNKTLQESLEINKSNVLLLESADYLKHSKYFTESEKVSSEISQTNDDVVELDSNETGNQFESEEKGSAVLIEELASKNENKEHCLVLPKPVDSNNFNINMSPRNKTPECSLEFSKECEREESKQSNKDIHSVLEEKDNLKLKTTNGISLDETTKEIKEDVSASVRKRSTSIVDEVEEADTKRVKSTDEAEFSPADNVFNSKNAYSIENTISKLKRRTSESSLQDNVVKKPKLFSDKQNDKDLAACADVLEVCVKFAEINASVSEKLKEQVCKGASKIVPEKIHNDSDVNFIRNILKSSIDTVGNSRSNTNKSNKKNKRKTFDGDATLGLNNSTTPTGSNKLQQGKVQVSQNSITNLDLAIERVVEGSKKNPEKKIPLLKKFHKEQLKNLTRHDLEELVIMKLCEAITDRSTIGELRLRCSRVEMIHDQWRKKVLQLEKSHHELELVLKRYLQEASNTKKDRQPLPIKVTRSVGLQVVLAANPLIRQKPNTIGNNNSSHQPSVQRRQHSVFNKGPSSSTQKPSTSTVPGTSKSFKTSFNHAVPEQTQSGIKVLTPKANQVDLHSPVNPAPPVIPRSTPTSTSTTTITRTTSPPKSNSLEVIDLTDKEEKSKQIEQTKQQTTQQQQQQKLKQQLMQQQQQQKQKQQLLQQKQQQYHQQKQLAHQNQQQVKSPTQQNQIKQPSPIQNNVQKQLQVQQPKPQLSQQQQNIAARVPTSVPQNGIRVVQAHQLTTNTPAQGMAILVPTAGQNGITRSSHLLIAASTPNQIRTSVPVIQPPRPITSTAPINITNSSTVMLRHGQVIPIQQSNPGILRSPPGNTLPLLKPRTGMQQVRQTSQPVYKHPAPLPINPQHPMKPGVKLPPPMPQLKIAKTVNGIMLSWSMGLTKDVADIVSYQLFAYQESSQPPNTALWKKVGDVKALPLPMACTLTQFVDGHKYHFSVRAVDVHSRIGPFSIPGSILLTNVK